MDRFGFLTLSFPEARSDRVVGRLKPGITVEQAQSDADRVARETMREFPADMRSLRIHAVVRQERGPLQKDENVLSLSLSGTQSSALIARSSAKAPNK
jgi:hypothetical protein